MSAMVMPGFHCISSARREISVWALGLGEAATRSAAFFRKAKDASASAIARNALRRFLPVMVANASWEPRVLLVLPGCHSARARPSSGLTPAARVGFPRFLGLKRFLDV